MAMQGRRGDTPALQASSGMRTADMVFTLSLILSTMVVVDAAKAIIRTGVIALLKYITDHIIPVSLNLDILTVQNNTRTGGSENGVLLAHIQILSQKHLLFISSFSAITWKAITS